MEKPNLSPGTLESAPETTSAVLKELKKYVPISRETQEQRSQRIADLNALIRKAEEDQATEIQKSREERAEKTANHKKQIQENKGRIFEIGSDKVPSIPENKFKKWFKNVGIATIFSAAGLFGSKAAHGEGGDTKGPKSKIEVYKKANTTEGAITPTGLNNSFYNNEFGITEQNLMDIAREHGFDTTSEKSLQADLVEYVHSTHPDIIDSVIKKYGNTTYGEVNNIADYKALIDSKIGGRTAFIVNEIIKKETPPEVKDSIPETPKPVLETVPHISLEGFDEAYVLFDNSGSMSNSKKILAEELTKSTRNIPVSIRTFSNQIDESIDAGSPQEAAEALKKIRVGQHSADEFLIKSVKDLLETIKSTPSKKLVASFSDEEFQGVEGKLLAEIKKLCEEKNVTLSFSMQEGSAVYHPTLSQIETAYKTKFESEEGIKKVQRDSVRVENAKSIIATLKRDIAESSGSVKKANERTLADHEEELKRLETIRDDGVQYKLFQKDYNAKQ